MQQLSKQTILGMCFPSFSFSLPPSFFLFFFSLSLSTLLPSLIFSFPHSEGGTWSVFHPMQRVEHRAFFISFRGWDTECFSSHSEGGTQSVFHFLQTVGHRVFFISPRVWDMERFSSHPEGGTWHPAIILRLGREGRRLLP